MDFRSGNYTIASVQPNVPAELPVPDLVQSATVPPVKVESTKLADGVWFLGGGSHHSLVVEFKDYIAVIEGPLNEARSMAVWRRPRTGSQQTDQVSVSTHHHFDHSGGLRTYVAEGATIVTHQSNVPYFEKLSKRRPPFPRMPSRRIRKRPPSWRVTDKYVLTDGKQTIEAYATAGRRAATAPFETVQRAIDDFQMNPVFP